MTAPEVLGEKKPVVLVVEDDADVRTLLAFNLRAASFDVVTVDDIASAPAAVERHQPAVVVLDRMLPDGDGVTLCARMRSESSLSDVGILVLSALGSESDRLDGLAAGADDYVVKPFSVRELVARVRLLVTSVSDRREARANGRHDASYRWGDLVVDRSSRRVTAAGVEIDLRPVELKLLCVLFEGRGMVMSREAILAAVWGDHAPPHPRAIDVHVQRLRVSLGSYEGVIQTVHGSGYRLAPSGEK